MSPKYAICIGQLSQQFHCVIPPYAESMFFGRTRTLQTGADDESRPRLSRDAYVLGVVAFFVMVGFGVVVPVLPVYARSFGVGFLEVGAIISAFALMRFVASPFVGRLIDLAGERVILTIGIAIVAVSSALSGFAQDYLHLLLMRGIGGVGSAMFSVSAMTLLLGSSAPSLRARSVGFYQAGFLIGGMAGPAIGGLLAAISLRAPFFFYAGTLAVAGLVGAILLRNTRAASAAEAAAATARRTPLRTVLRDSRFQAACVANFSTGWTSFGVRSALVPLLIVEVLREPSLWTGIAFAAAAVAQTVALAPAARFVDTVGRRPAIIGAYLAAGLVIVAVPFSPNVGILTVLLCLYGVAAAFMGTAPAAAVGDAAGAGGGRPVAVFSMFSDFGAIVGPLAAGFLADTVSYPVAFMVGAALLFVTSAFAFRMPRVVPAAI
jgi:MFS family permease